MCKNLYFINNILDDCVEIRPDQVHIHDSTAQMSTIQNKLTTVSSYISYLVIIFTGTSIRLYYICKQLPIGYNKYKIGLMKRLFTRTRLLVDFPNNDKLD